jgi:hypothetical protein
MKKSIVSVAVITDSIVSVNQNYEKRKRKRAVGRWLTHLPPSLYPKNPAFFKTRYSSRVVTKCPYPPDKMSLTPLKTRLS